MPTPPPVGQGARSHSAEARGPGDALPAGARLPARGARPTFSPMEAWQAVLVGLAGVLAGALVPAIAVLVLALLQVRTATARAQRVLEALAATAERVDRIGARLERGDSIERLVVGVESVSRLVGRLEDGARVATAVGAAVGPAVGAAVRAWRSQPAEYGPGGTGRDGSGSDRMGEAT
jgi:hypothetical protein